MDSITYIIHILIVEDSESDANLMHLELSEHFRDSIAITIANTTRDAVRVLGRSVFDILILDLNLPDSIGIETLSQIRDVNEDIPIIIVTGIDDKDIQLLTIAGGACRFIQKGIHEINDLPQAVLAAAELSRYNNKHDILIRSQIESLLELQRDFSDNMGRKVDKIYNTLFMKDDSRGGVALIDEISANVSFRKSFESKTKTGKWALATIVGSMLVAFGAYIFNLIFGTMSSK